MHWISLLLFLFCASGLKPEVGVKITPCPLVVVEGTRAALNCSGISGATNYAWSRNKAGSSIVVQCPVGTAPLPCNQVTPFTNISLISDDVSTLIIASALRSVFGNASILCRAALVSSMPIEDSCDVDVIYPADMTSCTISPATSDTNWTVKGSCYIGKVFSSIGKYSCELQEIQGGSELVKRYETTTYIPNNFPSSQTYYNGTCSYNATLPLNSATYTYNVMHYPGQVLTQAGQLVVVVPSLQPIISCKHGGTSNQYIPENTALNCTCTASDLGRPAGRLVGYSDSRKLDIGNYNINILELTPQMISRSVNGSNFTCVVDWATSDSADKRSAPYTVIVAFGPDTVTLSDPGVFDFHPVQSTSMNLTCTASKSNPDVTYTWSRLCGKVTDSTCSFTPTVKDHNTNITCSVTNTALQVTRNASRTITLNWPPFTAPNITGYKGQPLYAGQTLIIQCNITEGNPAVESVVISCQGHPDQKVEGQSSTVTIQVTAIHNGKCTCAGVWKRPDWYLQASVVNVTVYYAPQKPNITYKYQLYPFMAGESPVLYCLLLANNGQGNPPANLTWTSDRGQLGEGEMLPLGLLTAADHRRRIQCEATNDFTVWNMTRVISEMSLDVYYHPIVNITRLTADQCQFLGTSNTCIVGEGERVHVNCTVDSNPAPATITWTQSSNINTILDLRVNRTIDIVHTCNVSTRKVDSDTRLPLKGSQQLTLLVKYASSLESLTINSLDDNLTVSEGDAVTITCRAAGRPIPEVTLTTYGVKVKGLNKGNVTVEHLVTLTHQSTSATCNMSGPYTCNVANDLGPASSRSVDLFVNCVPRLDVDIQPDAEYNYLSRPIYINFTLLTYPATDIRNLYYNQNTSVPGVFEFRPARESLYSVVCKKTDRVYRTFCMLIIDNVTAADKGQYRVVFTNHMGNFSFTFKLDVNRTRVQEDSSGKIIGTAVGGALGAAAVAIIAAAVAVFFIKRRRAKESPTVKRERSLLKKRDRRNHREPELTVNSISASECDKNDDKTMIVNNLYGTAEVTAAHESQTRTPQCSDYEDVRLPPAAKPHVQPKPNVADKMSTANGEKDTYSVVHKGSKLVSNPANEYASVDKSKTAEFSGRNGKDAVKTGIASKIKSGAMQKPAKTKGKKEKKEKKEAGVYGNMPLSMNPIGCKVYENFGFQNEESETTIGYPPKEPVAEHSSANKDGLVYTTIQFTESQQKKAEHNPPKRETTEYVSIVFSKQPSISGD